MNFYTWIGTARHENQKRYPRVVSVPCSIKGKSLLKSCLGEALENIDENIVTIGTANQKAELCPLAD